MDFGNVDTRKWFAGTGLFVALLFAWINPEGSAPGHFTVRLAQWLLNVFVALALLIFVHERLNHWTKLAQTRPWLALTVSGVVASLIFSPLALALDVLFGENSPGGGGNLGWVAALVDELGGVVVTTTLVWLGMNAPAILDLDFSGGRPRRHDIGHEPIQARDSATADPEASAPGQGEQSGSAPRGEHPEDDFLGLLPDRIGRDVAWMKSELHYLRVVTSRGKAMVLFNLGDAVDCMPDDAGIMPHRSYWVAYRHVERLISNEGGAVLVMKDGARIPVARRRRAEVRKRIGL